MFRIGMMVRKNAGAAEKAREHHVAAGGIRGTGSQQVRRYDSEQRAQLENIPSLAPQYGNVGPVPRNGLDQCRLPQPFGPRMHTCSPRAISRLMSCSAARSPRMTVTCARESRGSGVAFILGSVVVTIPRSQAGMTASS